MKYIEIIYVRLVICSVLVFYIFILFPSYSRSQDLDLNNYDADTFSNLALVTGQVFGSGLYSTANSHSIGGFDAGVKTLIGFVPDSRQIGPLNNTNTFNIPVFHANTGVLGPFEVGIRLFSFRFGEKNREDVSHFTGILKYNVFEDGLTPAISLYSAYGRMSEISDFSLQTISIGAITGKSFLFIELYAGINVNNISMDVDLEPDGIRYISQFSRTYRKTVTHGTFGLSVTLAPFTNMVIDYNVGEIQTVTLGIFLSLF